MGGKKHKRKRKTKKARQTLADLADTHELYEQAVQSPEADCELFSTIYEELRGSSPALLREDFCGTAQLSLTWCLEDESRRAIGVDYDAATLEWGRVNNLEPNADAIGDRLQLIEADVLEVDNEAIEGADVVAALNFSFCIFKERHVLKRYLEQVYTSLADRGLAFFELFGGLTAIDTDEETRELEDFDYVWEQASFNPITNEIVCHIHFEFSDGSRLEKAFTYDWRLWSITEMRDLLYAVGFENVRVYWEKVEEEDEDDDDDDDGMLEGTGEYEEVEVVEQQDSWLVYIVAEKARADPSGGATRA
ncbi:hypothetical protein PPSIR1_33881 [Plesiocystis pacifica SIR-1]|uniref:Methyltransferase type 11 domain-containing protein n=1 Tax=Plesiocystis pacifica SIR-1 TaxID=391625 RepID=A6GBP3_9BACT|nr:class I SAM-dependent methyltransferase [Plesiocystis pacifica]EDM76749.1 hypothetical protein PPSIR1_33881 [Plesiocystis pacifica SIR-1]